MTEDLEDTESAPGFSVETDRLILRPAIAGDEAEIAFLTAGRRIAETLFALPSPGSGEIGEALQIVDRKSQRPIGAVMYGAYPDRPAATEIACWIGEMHWGHGYATEAMQAMIDRAFSDARIGILWCSNRVMNERARRVIEKCGFQFRATGMLRPPFMKGAVPIERFALERRTWVALRAWAGAARRDRGEGR